MGKLTTHVLDTSRGRPAAGVRVELWSGETMLHKGMTNADGRMDGPLLSGEAMVNGAYRLTFAVGDYFSMAGDADARRFLDVVSIEFNIDEPEAGYHVPLLVSPWSYSTYRGS